jgi:hypothetical protein
MGEIPDVGSRGELDATHLMIGPVLKIAQRQCLEEWIRPDSFLAVVRPVTSAAAITEAASACSVPARHHIHRHVR